MKKWESKNARFLGKKKPHCVMRGSIGGWGFVKMLIQLKYKINI